MNTFTYYTSSFAPLLATVGNYLSNPCFNHLTLLDTWSPHICSQFSVLTSLLFVFILLLVSLLHVSNCVLLILFLSFISDVLLLLCIPWLKLFPCEITWKWVPQEERVLSILHLGTLREPQGRWSVNSCCWAVRPNFSFSWLTCVLGIWIP